MLWVQHGKEHSSQPNSGGVGIWLVQPGAFFSIVESQPVDPKRGIG